MELLRISVADTIEVRESKLVLSFVPVFVVTSGFLAITDEVVFMPCPDVDWAPAFARAPSISGFVGGLNWQFA